MASCCRYAGTVGKSVDFAAVAGSDTTVTLHLKAADEEHGLRDYTNERVQDDIDKGMWKK